MSHWNNFPACSFMTDFEIVVVQNERARLERESLEQEELDAQQDNQIQDHHGIQHNNKFMTLTTLLLKSVCHLL